MDRQDRLMNLAEGFRECSKALAAIGDETRQSIIIALIEGESIAFLKRELETDRLI
ncbi:hypothetical protein MHH52_14220 [Paenibacillus sp. FSL K6-0276]|uniref:hypothetical protein n=1 Tax=Paenibacillus sp. FSL K6-0276 TaxID=2921450 RepID=UPI0030EDB6F8